MALPDNSTTLSNTLPNWALLDDLNEQASEQKRLLRLRNCGRQGRQIRITNGTFKSVYFYCGMHLECPRCLGYRAEKLKGDFAGALENEAQVVMVQLTTDEATKTLKKLTREEFLRYPLDNGQDIVVMDAHNAEQLGLAGQVVTKETISTIPWTLLARTPSGRKISGALTGSKVRVPQKDTVRIRTFTLVSDAPETKLNAALVQAVMDTESMNPHTLVELEEAIAIRTETARNYLLHEEYEATMHLEYVRFDPAKTKIDWREGTLAIYDQLDPEALVQRGQLRYNQEDLTNPESLNRNMYVALEAEARADALVEQSSA